MHEVRFLILFLILILLLLLFLILLLLLLSLVFGDLPRSPRKNEDMHCNLVSRTAAACPGLVREPQVWETPPHFFDSPFLSRAAAACPGLALRRKPQVPLVLLVELAILALRELDELLVLMPPLLGCVGGAQVDGAILVGRSVNLGQMQRCPSNLFNCG